MEKPKRNAVFVAPVGSIGRDLVFRHYTNKVVAATYSQSKPNIEIVQRLERVRFTDGNAYALAVMKIDGLKALYEKYLKEGETVYRKALMDYLNR